MNIKRVFTDGMIFNNPTFVQVIGMCPTLATTTSATNGFGMGLATTAVLIGSNVVISILRKIIPDQIRIPAFVVVIATFVTIIEMLLQAYVTPLYESLGIFLPLIVVNCIILARAEAFAFKNSVIFSAVDGLSNGLGFTLALTVLGIIRELLGAGSIFGKQIMWSSYEPMSIMTQAPGAFLVLGLLLALFGSLAAKKHNA
ncbi:electron transport complex subunit E [Alkaliphilus sp. MSJ-5]|uniref:Ion-translocating oxidoreductase complex subunit E n=1 Tax=Alkaliphilus flagellatus TaxID=2841507 RepID=A0ABS6G5C3_9FIRM|nr:electron transport complex subunit E [Alkaliphilus flagellatus]MBU5677694.1 electron transport complex subunit E [Alkaliphilus flagellatus]